MNFFRKRMNKKGFTLIELIIVIAILGILAALAIPRFFGFTESAKQAADEELANIVANAAILYYASEDVVPAGEDAVGTGPLANADYIEDAYVGADDLVSQKYGGETATIDIIDQTLEAENNFTLTVTITGAEGDTYSVNK